ncbi:unnamed protein product [Gongylonema pulchrum]|uniref:WW domain-containing protein n=1 Tax=Gongylonema pulchrum TaxID=637853 RepID=A0A183DQU9_9BILA|nr:unnamed protein product [Gongylonema pulchrum]
MIVCGELLTKMVEPLVSLPVSDSLMPPNSSSEDPQTPSVAVSPTPDIRSSAGNSGTSTSIRTLPLNYAGKLEIPTPWTEFMRDNKVRWKERAAKEEKERQKNEEKERQKCDEDAEKT